MVDLQRQKLQLNPALRPVVELNGFDRRYQIDFIGYALAIAGAGNLAALGTKLKHSSGLLTFAPYAPAFPEPTRAAHFVGGGQN